MSRQFSVPTVLRMVPNMMLREVLNKLGHVRLDPFWPKLKERDIEPILAFLADLPLEQSNNIAGVLRSIYELACPSGFDALLEAASCRDQPDFGQIAPEGLDVYGKSAWAWLRCRDVFEKAQIIHQVEQLTWWRKRSDLPETEPDTSLQAIAKLEREVSALLRSQGRGNDCTVETLAVGGVDYFFAHPDDFVQNVIVHDEDGKLAPQTIRQTMLCVFAYDRAHGSLETFAKLPKRLKEQLEIIFASAILHWELDRYEPDAAYELNQLKSASFDLGADPEDRLRIQITKMRLSARNSGRRIHVEMDKEDPRDDIHKAIIESVNLEVTPLSQWNATAVTFCFEFLPAEGRKAGQQTFDVTYPRSCSLRNARPERIALIQKYLRQWKIDRGSTNKVGADALGNGPAHDTSGGSLRRS